MRIQPDDPTYTPAEKALSWSRETRYGTNHIVNWGRAAAALGAENSPYAHDPMTAEEAEALWKKYGNIKNKRWTMVMNHIGSGKEEVVKLYEKELSGDKDSSSVQVKVVTEKPAVHITYDETATKKDLEEAIDDVIEAAGDKVDDLVEDAQETYEEAVETVQEVYEDVADKVEDTFDDVVEVSRKQWEEANRKMQDIHAAAIETSTWYKSKLSLWQRFIAWLKNLFGI